MATAARAQQQQRPQLLQAAYNAIFQADIREKLLFTFALLVVFRFTANLPVPGINPEQLDRIFRESTVLGFMNIFSGGALQNMSVAAMGVYPYITSSIVMQLMIPLVPTLQALSREGEAGRKQIQIYTHWMTVPMALVQAYGQLVIVQSQGGISEIGFSGEQALPTLSMIISMTAGTMFLVWIGELISERGIGNGISILIFAGIIAGLPQYVAGNLYTGAGETVSNTLILGFLTISLLYVIVVFQEAQRRIPVQYSRSVFRSGRMYRQSGQTHIPLRVNTVGMIPLIFAFSIIIFPAYVGSAFEPPATRRSPTPRAGSRASSIRGTGATGRSCSSLWWSSPSSIRWWSSSSRTWRRTCSGRAASCRASGLAGPRKSTSTACCCASPGAAPSSWASSRWRRSSSRRSSAATSACAAARRPSASRPAA
jgi:preprotein translocase subunit SecY